MPDQLKNALHWLARQQREYHSSDVIYRRGSQERNVPAVHAATRYELSDEYGIRTGAFAVDFLIQAEDLPFRPQSGDCIIADYQTYEVLELGAEGCWRWCDPYQITRRIHTKAI